jgi:hypothetical protein
MLVVVAVAAGALVSFGCSTVSVSSHRYLGAPNFPPTDPAKVEILRHQPSRPHEQLGEIVLRPSGEPDVARLEQALRVEAAKMGADAAVVVSDRTRRIGTYVDGWWWTRHAYPVYGRVIVAVGIKYR